MSDLNSANSKANLIIYLLYLHKQIKKTLEVVSICSRNEVSINKSIFFLLFPPHSKAMTSQLRNWSLAMLDQHFYDDAVTTITHGYQMYLLKLWTRGYRKELYYKNCRRSESSLGARSQVWRFTDADKLAFSNLPWPDVTNELSTSGF